MTDQGLRIGLFFTRSYKRLVRLGLSQMVSEELPENAPLRRAFGRLEQAMDQYVAPAKLISEA